MFDFFENDDIIEKGFNLVFDDDSKDFEFLYIPGDLSIPCRHFFFRIDFGDISVFW